MNENNNKIRVAINGFGRIGRTAFKAGFHSEELEFVAVNDLATPEALAALVKYDTNYGRLDREVSHDEHNIIVDGKKIMVLSEKDPGLLPWKDLNIDVVIESTGRFVKDGAAKAHIEAGAKRVILSAPAKGGGIKTFILGVNYDNYKGEDVISNASCTTNCISPVIHVLHTVFGVQKAFMSTVHSITAEQALVDAAPPAEHSDDLRRGRSAGQN